ncbi:MAG: hypothetical protein WC476_01140 [Phycisphaerae bacterium]
MSRLLLTKDVIELQKLLGKKTSVQVFLNLSSDCPDCTSDKISGQSTNAKCPTCKGQGKLFTEKRVKLPSFIQYNKENETLLSGGINEETSVQLYIDYRTVMNFNRFLNGRARVYIDNVLYEIVDKVKTGIYSMDMIIFDCQKVEK